MDQDQETKQSLAPERLNAIHALIAKARAEGVFGKDFSIHSVSSSTTDQAIRDAQTYTPTVDGNRWKSIVSLRLLFRREERRSILQHLNS